MPPLLVRPNPKMGARQRRALYLASQMALNRSGANIQTPTVASASTVNLNYSTGELISITGTESISRFTPAAYKNEIRRIKFSAAATLVYSATYLNIPGQLSVTATPGDIAELIYRGDDLWEVVSYQRAFSTVDKVIPHPPMCRLQYNNTTSIDLVPCGGDKIPIWNGTAWTSYDFSTINIQTTIAGPYTGSTTNGSPVITGITGDMSKLVPGGRVDVSAGFAAGTVSIVGVVGRDSIAVNVNATSSTTTTMTNFVMLVSRLHDVFAVIDDGVVTLRFSQSWDSDATEATVRGSPALNYQGLVAATSLGIELKNGIYVNSAPLVTGAQLSPGRDDPDADIYFIPQYQGTYVGTIMLVPDVVVPITHGLVADDVLQRFVWSMYNRRPLHMLVQEATNSWTYSSAAYRQANNAAANKFEFIRGLDEDMMEAVAMSQVSEAGATGREVRIGIGLDSVTANSAQIWDGTLVSTSANRQLLKAFYRGLPGLGYHYLAWLEYGAGAGTQTWYGDTGTSGAVQYGMVGSGRF